MYKHHPTIFTAVGLAALLALGLSAMHDGLWLEFCLDPDSFKVEQGMALCHAWLDAKLG